MRYLMFGFKACKEYHAFSSAGSAVSLVSVTRFARVSVTGHWKQENIILKPGTEMKLSCRKIFSVLAILAFLCLLASPSMAAYKAEYKLSVVPGATSGWGLSASYFADLVREASNDRIRIKVYHSSQLLAGKQTSEFLMLRNGAIDFALASTINWSGQVKELNLPALPFFIAAQPDRYKAMDAILTGKSGQMMIDAVEKKGVKVFGWAENGFRELTTSKGPIRTPEDLKGLKIRVVGSPIFIETFRALGANPVNMNWSEATTGFQQGLVAGQENPTNGINIPLKIWTFHKFHCDWHYVIDPLLFSVNPAVWQSFSEEDRKLLADCAKKAEKYSKALSRLGMDDGSALAHLKELGKLPENPDPYSIMEKNGMTVTRLTREEIEAFYQASESVRKSWTEKIGKALVEAAAADMADFALKYK